MKNNQPVTGRQITLPADTNILSTTEPGSRITYVNPDFIRACGYSEEELLGQPQNIVRHPDMPAAAFKHLWQTIRSGHSWMGLVKNRCKSGDHYWVSAYVSPIKVQGKLVEYQSVRVPATDEQIRRAESVYQCLQQSTLAQCARNFLDDLPLRWKLSAIAVAASTTVAAAASLLQPTLAVPLLATGLGAGLVSAGLLQWALRPFSELADKARTFADNPVSQKAYTGRADDLGQVEFAMHMLQTEAGAVIGRIGDAAHRLSDHAEQLVRKSGDNSQRSEQQLAQTDQVATAVNEMSASVQEVARNAHSASQAASSACQTSQAAGEQMESTRTAIQALAAEIRTAADVVHSLESHNTLITNVLEVIQAIAEQTNLLALNAAIESARAGEYGRGFSVVADEVRGLASRTQNSTHEIQEMIARVQEGTRQAVTVIQSSCEQAEHSVSQVDKVSEALTDIEQLVHQIMEMNSHIATAVEEQSQVSEEINRNVTGIRDAAEQQHSSARDSLQDASGLSELSRQLDRLADQFWARKKVF